MSDNRSPIEALKALEVQALDAVAKASDSEALEAIRIEYLGRKGGRISSILGELGKLDPAERPAVGAEANRVKGGVQQALEERIPVAGKGHRDRCQPDYSPALQPLGTQDCEA